MAFTLQIRQKKLFGKTALDIPSLDRACGLSYDSNNDFYILQKNEQVGGTAVFYNPERIGRRIFFDGSKAGEEYYELSYNIPTTGAEIADFVRLVGEMERRLGRAEMYCVEEGRSFTGREMEQWIENFAVFSRESLRNPIALFSILEVKHYTAILPTCRKKQGISCKYSCHSLAIQNYLR